MNTRSKHFLNLINYFKLIRCANENCYVPPGHFYSPVVSIKDIRRSESRIWMNNGNVQAIDLNINDQVLLLKEFESYYKDIPWSDSPKKNYRFHFNNAYYLHTDAIILYSFIRHFKPRRIIEIGSGFSSAVMLDTMNLFDIDIDISFIEPYPKQLFRLLMDGDESKHEVIIKNVQDVPLEYFTILEKNDILFIDSTHITKTGSDVNYIFFEILPLLKSGVLIQVHDIFSSFEYPKEWVYEGRSWNESYILRSFLMYNNSFKIKVFSNFLHTYRSDVFINMPLCYNDKGGSFWMEKLVS